MKLEDKLVAINLTKLINNLCFVSIQLDKYPPLQDLAEKAKIVYYGGKSSLSKTDLELMRYVIKRNEIAYGETSESKSIRKFLKEP